MHFLDPIQVGASQLGEHLQAKISDETMAEIGDGDVSHIFRDRLDDRHHHDGGDDPVDHLLVLGDEYIVGGPLDEEGDGAGSRRRQQHGDHGDGQQPDPRPQMLAPDAPHDLPGRIVDLKLVGAARDRVCVPEQLVVQAISPVFWRFGWTAARGRHALLARCVGRL